MAKIKVLAGYLSHGGFLYSKGAVIDVEDAAGIVARSKGRIAFVQDKPAPKQQAPKQEKPKKMDLPAEEGAALPDADPVAAVQKK